MELDVTWNGLALPGTFEDFVSADEKLAMAPKPTDQEIVDCVMLPQGNSSSESDDDGESEPPISSADAVDMTRRLRSYLEKIRTSKIAEVEKALLSMDTVESSSCLCREKPPGHIIFKVNRHVCLVCQMNFVLL